jgi:integrase/recombinase XerD
MSLLLERVMVSPIKIVYAETTDRGRIPFIVDGNLDFIPEIKAYIDYKSLRRAPNTLKAYCYRLRWFCLFLAQQQVDLCQVTPPDMLEFVLWLSNPYRHSTPLSQDNPAPHQLKKKTINLITRAVGGLYHFLVRRGTVIHSPVLYEEIPADKWALEGDMLAHIRRGGTAGYVKRMEITLKEDRPRLQIVSDRDFQTFLNSIPVGTHPSANAGGFRNRLMCLTLHSGGPRIGEFMGMRIEDVDVPAGGIHIRFRPDNENGARAKAGFGQDRFISLPPEVLSLLDMYIMEIWVDANPRTDHLWINLKQNARNRDQKQVYATALSMSAVEQMFLYYSEKSKVKIHPHMLRHTHATSLVRSYLRQGRAVDWKFIQDRLGHTSVVTTMQTYVHLEEEDWKLSYRQYAEKRRSGPAK